MWVSTNAEVYLEVISPIVKSEEGSQIKCGNLSRK